MFSKRLISSIVLVILAFVLILPGSYTLGISLFAVSCIAFNEMMNVFFADSEQNKKRSISLIGLIGIGVYYLFLMAQFEMTWMLFVIVMTFLAMMSVYVLTFPKLKAVEVIAAFFSFFYAPILLSFIYLTRNMKFGIYIVWMIFISSWICDTCAYLSGMLLGKHRLAPVLSPKKSIEGAIGGVIGSALVGALFGYFIEPVIGYHGILYIFTVIGACGAVVSQIGDLAASAIKRNYDIKDYGKLIPGHGGIMDRFDSVIFAAPMIYFLAEFFLRQAG
ncbi:MAG: phosphatidate cytidylyltransferase [Lachnospiraceae bacterium]|nr:phosphatidate cytidylyltransferase [Lachnospiraceae bacterium]MDD3660158.1 phosphatidate cytidylyltransferase [Lachnospiraceae bacterium]